MKKVHAYRFFLRQTADTPLIGVPWQLQLHSRRMPHWPCSRWILSYSSNSQLYLWGRLRRCCCIRMRWRAGKLWPIGRDYWIDNETSCIAYYVKSTQLVDASQVSKQSKLDNGTVSYLYGARFSMPSNCWLWTPMRWGVVGCPSSEAYAYFCRLRLR